MPALPVVPNVIRAEFLFQTTPTNFAGCRRFYSYTGTAPSNATCAAIAADIHTEFSSHLNGLMSDDFSLNQIEVTDLSSNTGGQGAWDGTLVGARSGTAVSVSTAVNLGFDIARRYRGGRPKIYLPFGINTDLGSTQNEWSSTFTAAVDTGWTAFDAAVQAIVESGTTIAQNVNISFYEGFVSSQNPITKRWRNIPTPRTTALIDIVTGHQASSFLSQQRRRTRSVS